MTRSSPVSTAASGLTSAQYVDKKIRKKNWKKREKDASTSGLGTPSEAPDEDPWRRNFLCGEEDPETRHPPTLVTAVQWGPTPADKGARGLESGGLYSQFLDLQLKTLQTIFFAKSDFDPQGFCRLLLTQTQTNQKIIDFLEAQTAADLSAHAANSQIAGLDRGSGPPPVTSLSTQGLHSEYSKLSQTPFSSLSQTERLSTADKDGHLPTATSMDQDEPSFDAGNALDNDFYRVNGTDRTLVGLPLSPIRKWSCGSADCDHAFWPREGPRKEDTFYIPESFFDTFGQKVSPIEPMDDGPE